jgi:hypothetical protein
LSRSVFTIIAPSLQLNYPRGKPRASFTVLTVRTINGLSQDNRSTMAQANPVCYYYMTHTLGIPAVASRAITEEGLEQFEDLIGISDEHVLAIIKNSHKRFYNAAAAAAAAANRPPSSLTDLLPESISWCFVAGICIEDPVRFQ